VISRPLVVSESDVDTIVERLARAVDKLTESLRAEGLWNGYAASGNERKYAFFLPI
jgi:hypothetical protein